MIGERTYGGHRHGQESVARARGEHERRVDALVARALSRTSGWRTDWVRPEGAEPATPYVPESEELWGPPKVKAPLRVVEKAERSAAPRAKLYLVR